MACNSVIKAKVEENMRVALPVILAPLFTLKGVKTRQTVKQATVVIGNRRKYSDSQEVSLRRKCLATLSAANRSPQKSATEAFKAVFIFTVFDISL